MVGTSEHCKKVSTKEVSLPTLYPSTPLLPSSHLPFLGLLPMSFYKYNRSSFAPNILNSPCVKFLSLIVECHSFHNRKAYRYFSFSVLQSEELICHQLNIFTYSWNSSYNHVSRAEGDNLSSINLYLKVEMSHLRTRFFKLYPARRFFWLRPFMRSNIKP